jgi:uncharacterized protein
MEAIVVTHPISRRCLYAVPSVIPHRVITCLMAASISLAFATLLSAEASTRTHQGNPEESQAPVRDESRNFEVYIKNARQLRNENIVMQQRDFSCGAAAVATIVNHFWDDQATETGLLIALAMTLTEEELKDRVENGLTLTDLKRVCERFGYQAVLGRLTLDKLAESKIPLLVGITVNDYDHFVVIRGADDRYVYLADPAVGRQRVPLAEFAKQWQKNTVLAIIKPNTRPPSQSALSVTLEDRRFGESNDAFLRNSITGRF